ncbi:MAG: HAD family hydrolase, partial [Terriglobia bacterium]
MTPKIRALLFDAGNTLVFPQVGQLARELSRWGYPASREDFHKAECTGKARLDEWLLPLLKNGDVPRQTDYFYWKEYLSALVDIVRVPEEKKWEISLQIAEGFKRIGTWSEVVPETPTYLETLRRRGYFMGVISNSLGLIEEQLQRVGLAGYFTFILDSHYVGVEKPHPEIFQQALDRAGCEPAEAVYIGDLYST